VRVVVKENDPSLLTAAEVAELLRTSRKCVYWMIERGRLPGVTRIGRRVLLRRDRLLQFLAEREEQCASSLGEKR
jgi:excisionase family DNA binding protein